MRSSVPPRPQRTPVVNAVSDSGELELLPVPTFECWLVRNLSEAVGGRLSLADIYSLARQIRHSKSTNEEHLDMLHCALLQMFPVTTGSAIRHVGMMLENTDIPEEKREVKHGKKAGLVVQFFSRLCSLVSIALCSHSQFSARHGESSHLCQSLIRSNLGDCLWSLSCRGSRACCAKTASRVSMYFHCMKLRQTLHETFFMTSSSGL
ncbi:hypothetical protein EJ06DRAFT_328650 [Trichodelitschia bisporula]|uniref:Uncharacterized protein n=1 Tax=Trichodelitschia bisporula TaxID=703511 RepID=A0A6G1I292_9PEZI|nr:hypothetical protein EJ06DRAFT_328650 [Trichodelitschia bisporula]